MATPRYKKGDLVIVDENGKPAQYEILSALNFGKRAKVAGEQCYEAKDAMTGMKTTISNDQILRLATPVDDSAELFRARQQTASRPTAARGQSVEG